MVMQFVAAHFYCGLCLTCLFCHCPNIGGPLLLFSSNVVCGRVRFVFPLSKVVDGRGTPLHSTICGVILHTNEPIHFSLSAFKRYIIHFKQLYHLNRPILTVSFDLLIIRGPQIRTHKMNMMIWKIYKYFFFLVYACLSFPACAEEVQRKWRAVCVPVPYGCVYAIPCQQRQNAPVPLPRSFPAGSSPP